MSTNFPGDLTSGFSAAVPIPPESQSSARGGLIWLSTPGRVQVGPIDGDGPWSDVGTLTDAELVGELFSLLYGSVTFEVSTEAPGGILDRIDRAVARLCPCGAEPDPAFHPYCGYDCKPNWRGQDTTSDYDRTPMRWRPDLVGQADDTHLTSYVPRSRCGRFWVEVFERAGTEQLHVRVDDDHRWVGADVAREPAEDFEQRYGAKLQALMAELENKRHAVPSRPPTPAGYQRGRAVDIYPDFGGHIDWHLLRSAPAPEPATVVRDRVNRVFAMARALADFPAEVAETVRAWRISPSVEAAEPDPVAEHRQETLRWVRQRRNAGPQPAQRAARRIDPRRAR